MNRHRSRITVLAIPLFLLGMAFSAYQYTSVGDLPEDRLAQEIESLLDQIADAPNTAALRIRLARLYEQHDEIPEAIQILTEGLARRRVARRSRYDMYVELSRLYLEKGDAGNAYRTASLARKLFPARAPAYNRRGQSHEARGSSRKAVREYKRAESVDPNDPESYFRRALLHEKRGRMDQAEALFREAVARAPGNAHALIHLAEFLLRQGRTKEALEVLERAVALAPRDALVRLAYARALEKDGQDDRAISEYKRANELDPRVSEAAEAAGDIYFSRRDFRKATDQYEKALHFDRKNSRLIRKYRRARRMLSPESRSDGSPKGKSGKEAAGNGNGPGSSDTGSKGASGSGRLPGSDAQLEPANETPHRSDSEDAARLKALGRARYLAREYDQARALFARAAAIAPKDDESQYLLGRALLRLKRPAEGIRALEQALLLNPKNGSASFHLGLAEYEKGRHAAAVPRFRAAAEHSVTLRDQAVFNQGRSLEKSGNAQAALAAYERVVASPTLGPSAALNYAVLSRKTKQMGRAQMILRRATAQFPKQAELWFQRGAIQEALGKHRQAETSYQKAVGLKPDYFAAWFNSGVLAGRLGHHDQAVTAFEKATAILPADAAAHYELGRALQRSGRQPAAERALAVALEHQPGHPGATILLAPWYLESGKKDEAVRLLAAARAKHPDHYDLAFNAGNLLRKAGRQEACRLAYRDALRLEPTRPDAYMNLALSYSDTKNHDRAARVYEALLQRLPDHAPAHEQLGLLYYRELNRPQDGARHIGRFLRLRPNAPNGAALRRLLGTATRP